MSALVQQDASGHTSRSALPPPTDQLITTKQHLEMVPHVIRCPHPNLSCAPRMDKGVHHGWMKALGSHNGHTQHTALAHPDPAVHRGLVGRHRHFDDDRHLGRQLALHVLHLRARDAKHTCTGASKKARGDSVRMFKCVCPCLSHLCRILSSAAIRYAQFTFE